MSGKSRFTLVVLVLAVAAGLSASPALRWSTSLDMTVATGDTRYLMEEPAAGVSSELIFPLNTLLTGASLRGESSGGRRGWAVEASVAVSILAPFGKMEDWDWWMFPGTPKVPFSFTESEATMFWITASASWQPVLAAGGWGRLNAVVGSRFHYVYQEINGFNGWFWDDITSVGDDDPSPPNVPDGRPELYSQYGEGIVLTYRVLYLVPTAGMGVTLTPVSGVFLRLEAGLAMPYVSDEDDHVLRYKLSTASGLGFGGYASLLARYTWRNPQSRLRPYLQVAGSAFAAKASTQQTQTYYTGATEAPPGTSFSGIDHQISTRQFGGVLTFGFEF
jgi:hypothetical protein